VARREQWERDVREHTAPPYRGLYADGFHPNDRGYAQWVAALSAALEEAGHLPE
jgi:lysophospholipase L1-like esterase